VRRGRMPKSQQIHSLVPRDLYRAVKAELRAQDRTVREWLIEKMTEEIRKGPQFRAFLKEQAQRPEADETGLLRKS